MSRPGVTIDWAKVDDLLLAGCLGTEVAAYFGCHPETFYKRVEEEKGIGFTEYRQIKKSKGESILRSVQYARAIGATKAGNDTMLIWLGKNRLNQRDGQDITFSQSTVDVAKAIAENKPTIE
jgi:hypothetical protein